MQDYFVVNLIMDEESNLEIYSTLSKDNSKGRCRTIMFDTVKRCQTSRSFLSAYTYSSANCKKKICLMLHVTTLQ